MPEKLIVDRADFPRGFQFGTATSSYQIEGSSFGGCGLSHWDTFAATPGNTARSENGSIACDHYHLWESDLDLIKDAGFDSYRFSTSWARVQPDGRGAANPDGLDFYDRLVDGMLARDIKPYVTLYHWDLPAPLAALGGWQNRDICDRFGDYTRLIMERIGDRCEAAATFNEPWCIAWLSHFLGHHAPGIRDIKAAARAMHFVLLAHGKSVAVMRDLDIKNVGIVLNFEYAQAADDKTKSLTAAKTYDAIYNRWFLGGIFKGEYPPEALAGLEQYLPNGWGDDFDIIGQSIDWLGVNYYTRKLIGHDGSKVWPSTMEIPGPLEKTDVDWEIYPEGLHYFLTWIHNEYTGQLPIHVTENGLASTDVLKPSEIEDEQRIRFLNTHLEQVKRAIGDGVPLKSYFIWSLLDNYEWALGYDKRFGLVHVDFETLIRTPKKSWHLLKAALSKNRA